MFNLYNLFSLTAGSYPERPSFIYNDKIYTFKQVHERVNSLAHGLYKAGVRPRDTVGMLMYNGVDFFTMFYAAQKLGVALVMLNWRLTYPDQAAHINISKCDFLIYEESMAEGIASIKDEICVKTYISRGKGEELEFGELMKAGDPEWAFDPQVNPEDPALYLLTGGTSALSKVAVATQEKMMLRATLPFVYDGLDYTHEDNFLLFNPMFHFGSEGIYMPVSIAGGCITMMDKMDVEGILQAIEKYKVTRMLLLPPVLCHRIQENPELQKYDRSSVKHVTLSGGASSANLAGLVFETFPNCVIRTCYGGTEFAAEIGHVYTKEEYEANPEIATSIGKRAGFTYIKLLDDDGNEVGPNELGECTATGPAMFKEYLGKPSPFVDGWFHTGDILEMDDKGYYYFRDRKGFMVKTGGENVIPTEVESAINLHPKVQKSAVFGLPDKKLGEKIAAVVVLNPGESATEEEIIEFTRQHIASYKKPKSIFFMDDFCYTTVGKIDKRAMRAICEELDKN